MDPYMRGFLMVFIVVGVVVLTYWVQERLIRWWRDYKEAIKFWIGGGQ